MNRLVSRAEKVLRSVSAVIFLGATAVGCSSDEKETYCYANFGLPEVGPTLEDTDQPIDLDIGEGYRAHIEFYTENYPVVRVFDQEDKMLAEASGGLALYVELEVPEGYISAGCANQ